MQMSESLYFMQPSWCPVRKILLFANALAHARPLALRTAFSNPVMSNYLRNEQAERKERLVFIQWIVTGVYNTARWSVKMGADVSHALMPGDGALTTEMHWFGEGCLRLYEATEYS